MKTMPNLIGKIGEFTTGDGIVCQCEVTGYEDHDPELLIINYANGRGERIENAYISRYEFRPDLEPL